MLHRTSTSGTWQVSCLVKQESRAIVGRTARCRCKFRYVSNFTI